MAISALNMTQYFGGYPFQGKRKQNLETINNLIIYLENSILINTNK